MRSLIWRCITATLAIVGAGSMLSTAAVSADYPEKPIRIVVPYQPGGGIDMVARLIGPKLSDTLKQPVIVENKPGASGMIAAGTVAKASPNGYTILIDAPGIAMNPALFRNVPYDPLQDIEPVAQLISLPFVVVVNQNVEATTVRELISLAKSKSKHINVAAGGPTSRLAGELFSLQAGIVFTFIPYKGTAPASTSVVTGETQVTFGDLPSVAQHLRSGVLKALAVTGAQRTNLLPHVPTVKESGLESYEVASWYGIFAPGGTPKDVVGRLNLEFGRIVFLGDISARLSTLGGEPVSITPTQFAAFYRDEVRRWKDVVQRANVKVDD